ncbi:chromosome segregation protein SMC [Chondrinema litorale]|uniref:chromosome segregation protein SMC n=1 Tax=Chondrinema litorale TaxID=2994555 RepID=UPI002544ACC4|nr:chromosome segregation protein SMC [Chondrinema litorale]UZR93745.1 chromosome segregation protein SMC [Chondrinema litorale]
MLLQRLEIKGFKSFGEKVVLNFDIGVTGVVGPNGSGKSNVVDAIRWVLGEQSSKALRSEKMENVIFNGTKNRKAQQMAEVGLSFKNTKNLLPTEYSEITITRRYYRSGDSEYLLNGVTCRLKDIQSLFMDTGISSDSYAIIELKMVDEILNDQNQSRRQLFEEAAGISKFKKRKKETLKKLADTSDDLERVEDLLHEIGKNMRSLERQAKQAERYLKLKKEYKELSIVLAKELLKDQVEKTAIIEKEIENASDQKLSIQKQQSEGEAALEKEKLELVKKEQLLSSRQKTLNNHVNKIRQFESEKKIKSERLRFLTEKANSLQSQLLEELKSNERAKFSIEGLLNEKESLEKQIKEATFLLDKSKQEFENQKGSTDKLKEQLKEISLQFKTRQNRVYQLKKDLEISQVQQSSLMQELEKEHTESTEKSASLDEFDFKLGELTEELAEKQEQLGRAEFRQNELDTQIESAEASLQKLKEELAKSSRELDAKQNEYNLTKSMVDNLEGYPQAIKFLKKQTNWGKNFPLLSDIIAAEEKYRVCIENYLEPYLNYYILDNEALALEAVNLLSDSAKGKGNFLVLDKFKSFSPSAKRQFEDAIPAINIVEFDDKYRELVHYMLDNVYVVTSNQESIPKDNDFTFITQNGKVIKRKYSVSGGSVGLFEGKKLGRAKNLEKLSERIKELQSKNKNLDKIINQKIQDISYLKSESQKDKIGRLQEEISILKQENVSIVTKKEQFSELLLDQQNRRENIEEKLSQLRETIEQLHPELEDEEGKLSYFEENQDDLRATLEEENELLNQKSAAFNQNNISYHTYNNKFESIEKEISYKENAFDRGKAKIENHQEDLKHTEQEIVQMQETSGNNEDELVGMYDEKSSIEEGVNEAEKDYYASRGEIAEYEKVIREYQRKKEQLEGLILDLKDKINQEKMKTASVKERVSVEFEVDVDELLKPIEETEEYEGDLDSLKEKVVNTKKKMENIGPINHMAIEAYNEIKERNDFISEQKKDLIEAIDSLNTTIAEIDKVAKENFMDAFTKVRSYFIEVFRSLFTDEDSCDLILLDESDPLNSKIEIIAQPKGKKPLTINQLSGGEKTLTATALLFAIYLLKPAPFCIFDEVDAPLDDANIDKFNNIIKKFSENSQFIIVTHNKRTMSTTDVIYGITMIEQGVSTVVPVDLREMS